MPINLDRQLGPIQYNIMSLTVIGELPLAKQTGHYSPIILTHSKNGQ